MTVYRNGECKQLAARYREFNMHNLLHVASQLTSYETRCLKVLKCVEGQYNKAFILTMCNGDEFVARLPNPNAGPAFYTMASEVATRHFVREVLGLPVPKIYTWSADASNPVGCEYIIEEKAAGQPLGNIWSQMSMASQLGIIDQVVDMEKKLASVSFPIHGCLYYTSDLRSGCSEIEGLDIMLDKSVMSTVGHRSQLSQSAIGPSNDRRLWQSERHSMKLDRGPWINPVDFATALGTNELTWAESHAEPRHNFYRSVKHPESPDEYRSLIQRYLKVAPYLIPNQPTKEPNNTLSHPDLHLDNIFIDPETHQITQIIDWQLAAITPFCLQRPHPQMLELSRSPRTDEQRDREEELLNYYYKIRERANLPHSNALTDPHLSIRLNPITLVPSCWEREDTFSLRDTLIKLVAYWDQIYPGLTPCPIDFTEEELAAHQCERDLIAGVSTIVEQLEEEGLISIGGMVRPDEYDHARMVSNYFKKEFMDLAENDQQREIHAKVWPY
ncbi:hypothetical protein BO78DRAFT_240590 [Aspergillus sclerotiicarbonarius CBS 121057]|uniref:Aminoglycoside phosphotransferase domain-containing protein n=1 Tax=Aspergillus sclerotiicarbonarius (strain CBS 121057 / IBT 28362) TaxID=1448318 RepID=A0A319E5S0_ASPSB|nr:hypothetical protein BO78DRAFT_240590 [Aspergillus sclerotiicarbonarius CBS 121057]